MSQASTSDAAGESAGEGIVAGRLAAFASLPARPARAWHYASGGTKVGPVDQSGLESRIAGGEIVGETLVWTPGMQQWARADHIVELHGIFGLLRGGAPPAVATYPGGGATAPWGVGARAPADPVLRHVIPVGRSSWAVVAGYLGLFSVLLAPAPFAVLTGVMGLRDIKKNPHLLGVGRAWFGIAMGGLITVGALGLWAWALVNR